MKVWHLFILVPVACFVLGFAVEAKPEPAQTPQVTLDEVLEEEVPAEETLEAQEPEVREATPALPVEVVEVAPSEPPVSDVLFIEPSPWRMILVRAEREKYGLIALVIGTLGLAYLLWPRTKPKRY